MTKVYRDENDEVVNIGDWDYGLTPRLDENNEPVLDKKKERILDATNPLPENLTETEEDVETMSDGSKVISSESYIAKRRLEYPSTEDQLDDIFHNGIEGWKNNIQSIKDRNPKPEESVPINS